MTVLAYVSMYNMLNLHICLPVYPSSSWNLHHGPTATLPGTLQAGERAFCGDLEHGHGGTTQSPETDNNANPFPSERELINDSPICHGLAKKGTSQLISQGER